MKQQKTLALTALALSAFAWTATAQAPGGPQGGGQGGPPPPPPILTALDANHDGVIDTDEIAKAADSLKTLDQSGEGKLTMAEWMPQPPPEQGQGAGQAGQKGKSTRPARRLALVPEVAAAS